MTAASTSVDIVPAVIALTIEEYAMKVRRVDGLTAWLQLDFVDGVFGPNATVSPEDVASHSIGSAIEAHLMVVNPSEWVRRVEQLRPGRIFAPVETTSDLPDLAAQVRGLGAEFGLAINPDTPLDFLLRSLDECDRVLVLGVTPGRQGQQFRPHTVQRIETIRAVSSTCPIEVDGGVNLDNAPRLVAAGATALAVGGYLQAAAEPARAVAQLMSAAGQTPTAE